MLSTNFCLISGNFHWSVEDVAKSIVCMVMSGPFLTGYAQVDLPFISFAYFGTLLAKKWIYGILRLPLHSHSYFACRLLMIGTTVILMQLMSLIVPFRQEQYQRTRHVILFYFSFKENWFFNLLYKYIPSVGTCYLYISSHSCFGANLFHVSGVLLTVETGPKAKLMGFF